MAIGDQAGHLLKVRGMEGLSQDRAQVLVLLAGMEIEAETSLHTGSVSTGTVTDRDQGLRTTSLAELTLTPMLSRSTRSSTRQIAAGIAHLHHSLTIVVVMLQVDQGALRLVDQGLLVSKWDFGSP